MKKRKVIILLIIIASYHVSCAQTHADTYVLNTFVNKNKFRDEQATYKSLPNYFKNRQQLPTPAWPKRQDIISCYWKAWQIAFQNIQAPTSANHFISQYIDPAFNGNVFMWDTSFMVLFGRYGQKAFDFQGSLNNFYHTQHKDGYICREISAINGFELFERFDPSSTGPNIMPWAEWEYYLNFNDLDRLKNVFDPLVAYYQWFRANRSWPDGSYFSTGWGCGMDNQPRVPAGFSNEFSPAFMSWIDTNLQQLLAGKILMAMAKVLHRENDIENIFIEVQTLTSYVQKNMWDNKTNFFYDRFRDGSLSDVKSIGAYWALLAEVIPVGKTEEFIEHLENKREFATLHRVPTLSADHRVFTDSGNYWQGGVWAPTNYMVLRGLTNYKKDSLAFEIAYNHLNNVVDVFNKTGTLWENYAPGLRKGMFKKDMVGWTGLAPISVLFEYVFGIRPDVSKNLIIWDIRLRDEFGVSKYPYKKNGLIDFWCAKRKRETDKPKVKIRSSVPVNIKLIWRGGNQIIHINPKQT
jgi:hypothetical protein